MPVNTTTAAIYITPVVVKTFIAHARRKAYKLSQGDNSEEAIDDLLFDQAFHIVKSFIELATKNTIESLQKFTNTHVPAPFWSLVVPVLIPFASCNKAADVLVEWFGPVDLKNIVGGEKWWQVRGLEGVDAEWVTEKGFLPDTPLPDEVQTLSDAEKNILRMENLDTVMLYVHGGGYFWGSINTHRYQVIRYARKMKGRAFAVNYRKAPQYPWPCPIQDVLAAYFYLIEPPPGAVHKPVPPGKIVLAGDSAGGGLCISVLSVLRDMGIPLPAGAVLISPWVDLTHSFPSVMKNTTKDIIPPHGFIHKPSPLWPNDPLPKAGESRAQPTQTNPPPKPGHADTLRPSKERVESQVSEMIEQSQERGHIVRASSLKEDDEKIMSQGEMIREGGDDPDADETGAKRLAGTSRIPGEDESEKTEASGKSLNAVSTSPTDDTDDGLSANPSSGSSSQKTTQEGSQAETLNPDDPQLEFWEPKPPKVLMEDSSATPLELRSQIQQYATTEQLTHPLVSPILQGSLGNLCPLYIIAGNHEVLRDEIIYLAHKAAYPSQYPTREGVLRSNMRQKETAEKYTKPTRVHLQVYDDMCHVLTVFTFTDPAKYAYRSIAQFVKHVTCHSPEHLEVNPFPELHTDLERVPDSEREGEERSERPTKLSALETNTAKEYNQERPPLGIDSYNSGSDIDLYKENKERTRKAVRAGQVDKMRAPGSSASDLGRGRDSASCNGASSHRGSSSKSESGASKNCSDCPVKEDLHNVLILRERVNIFGHVRQMEPQEEIEALTMNPREIGIIKEAPVKRWLKGQEMWDKKYKHAGERAIKKRRHYEEQAERLLRNAKEQGLMMHKEGRPPSERLHTERSTLSVTSVGRIEADRRWGPLDLDDEFPPPSAIAKRRDTRDAVALLKKNIYHNAPRTHSTVPRLKTSDAVRAAMDPRDSPTKPPQQSSSEEQVKSHLLPVHGLRIWQSLVTLFMRKSTKKAVEGRKHASSAIAATTDKIRTASTQISQS